MLTLGDRCRTPDGVPGVLTLELGDGRCVVTPAFGAPIVAQSAELLLPLRERRRPGRGNRRRKPRSPYDPPDDYVPRGDPATCVHRWLLDSWGAGACAYCHTAATFDRRVRYEERAQRERIAATKRDRDKERKRARM